MSSIMSKINDDMNERRELLAKLNKLEKTFAEIRKSQVSFDEFINYEADYKKNKNEIQKRLKELEYLDGNGGKAVFLPAQEAWIKSPISASEVAAAESVFFRNEDRKFRHKIAGSAIHRHNRKITEYLLEVDRFFRSIVSAKEIENIPVCYQFSKSIKIHLGNISELNTTIPKEGWEDIAKSIREQLKEAIAGYIDTQADAIEYSALMISFRFIPPMPDITIDERDEGDKNA